MPFAVFRRHQRQLLAIFAILAMVGFVLSDSLPALLRLGGINQRADLVVAELYGKAVHRSELAELSHERSLANAYMVGLMQQMYRFSQPDFFGKTNISALVDAYILQHEADKLGIPSGPEVAREWLRDVTRGQMDVNLFESLLARFRSQNVTGEQMLVALASQIRLAQVRTLPGLPEVTPLDVFQAYRDRYERVSVRAVRFPVADYVSQVKEPSDVDLKAFYDRYKDAFPDPLRETPGFKIPRLVQVEYVWLDAEAIARDLRAKLTDQEIESHYQSRKKEFTLPPLEALPASLFADDPKNKWTPPPAKPSDASPELVPDSSPRYKPLSEVRTLLESDLSREKTREVIIAKFDGVREVMYKFYEAYNDALEDRKEAKNRGETNLKPLPQKPDLRPAAAKESLTPETTPLLTKEAAELYGQIGSSRVGLSRESEIQKTFADETFAPNAPSFDPIDLVNDRGQVFLAWKIADNPSRVPPLSEIRSEVVYAWKLEKARPLALEAAQALADKAKQAGGLLTLEMAGDRPVFTTDALSKLETQVLRLPGQFNPPHPRPTDIPQIPNAGDTLRDAVFPLEPGGVAVAPDLSKSNYYVLTLDKRYPVSYATLYAPSGPFRELQVEVFEEARERRHESWLVSLRAKAGLKPDWSPPEEAEGPSPHQD